MNAGCDADKHMPYGMSKRYDTVRLEKQHACYVQCSTDRQLRDP